MRYLLTLLLLPTLIFANQQAQSVQKTPLEKLLNYIERIETGEYTPKTEQELTEINRLIAFLILQGTPEDQQEELMHDLTYAFNHQPLTPAEYHLCKSNPLKRLAKNTSNVIAQNRKALIIGSAAVIGLYLAVGIAGAVGGAAIASAFSSDEKKPAPPRSKSAQKIIKAHTQKKPESPAQQATEFAGAVGHHILDEIAQQTEILPEMLDTLQSIPHIGPALAMPNASPPNLTQMHHELLESMHDYIDYKLGAKRIHLGAEHLNKVGLPYPSSAVNLLKNIQVYRQARALGYARKTIREMHRAGTLEPTVFKQFSTIANNGPLYKSYLKFKKAEEFLRPHRGFMEEYQIRKLLKRAGMPTFNRPKGIPKSFRTKLSNGGCGIIYVHPKHTHTNIRVMPAKPHSGMPGQSRPYVIHKVNSKILDKHGKVIDKKEIKKGHIPLKEFIYREF
ncbi:MAG: hypothetical protein MRY21_04020 [Simkaniaceae bacterium]|nr:hypothetical protein [Simkaniaceae bacterium]